MKFNYTLVGVGVVLIALAVFLFIRRSHLADEAYGLERERERLALERTPEERERFLRVIDESSRLNTDVRNTGVASVACGILGVAAAAVGVIRLRRKQHGGASEPETRS